MTFEKFVEEKMRETNPRTGKKFTKDEATDLAGYINSHFVHHYRGTVEHHKNQHTM